MKKVVIIYILSIITLFFLPIIMVKKYEYIDNEEKYSNMNIKLLLSETNEVVDINLDDYIMGVLVGEMPVTFEMEALKAQAIVARTYTLNKIINSQGSHEIADMCDNINHCQAYKTKEYAFSCWDDEEEIEKWNKIKEAVLSTQDLIITYDGELINAFFHSNSGGKTEDIENIWGREEIPYLKSVEGNEKDIRNENVIISFKDFDSILKEKYLNYTSIFQDNGLVKDINELVKITEINSTGRVSKMQISNLILDGMEVRSLFNLRSTMFNIEFDENNIKFNTKGYGHGVGLSQVGANDMALDGANYESIIKHYYTGVEIEKIK